MHNVVFSWINSAYLTVKCESWPITPHLSSVWLPPWGTNVDFMLDEDLSQINWCCLNWKMRNTGQLLGSLGLFSHLLGALEDLSDAAPCAALQMPVGLTESQSRRDQANTEKKNNVHYFSGTVTIFRCYEYAMIPATFSIQTMEEVHLS